MVQHISLLCKEANICDSGRLRNAALGTNSSNISSDSLEKVGTRFDGALVGAGGCQRPEKSFGLVLIVHDVLAKLESQEQEWCWFITYLITLPMTVEKITEFVAQCYETYSGGNS